jgi:hypothetical protein
MFRRVLIIEVADSLSVLVMQPDVASGQGCGWTRPAGTRDPKLCDFGAFEVQPDDQ